MFPWIVGGIAAVIILALVGLRIARVLWVANFIAVYNRNLDQEESPRDAIVHVVDFYSKRPPFNILGPADIQRIADSFESIPGHERFLGRIFLELDRKRDATVLTVPTEVDRMAEVAKKCEGGCPKKKISRSLFANRPHPSQDDCKLVTPKLASEYELIREQFVFACVSTLKSEGAPVGGISPLLRRGSELDAALKGFQLTNIMGFAWNYIHFDDQLTFDSVLTERVASNDADMTQRYRERYLDCQGDIELLASSLAEDIHRIWGYPEPSDKFKRGLFNSAIALGIVSQATTASVFGDRKTERKLRSKLSC